MKDNIHVVKSSINSFNSTITKLNQNELKLNTQINKLNEIILQTSHNNDRLALFSRLNNLVNIIQGSLLTISNFLDTIINSILFAKVNILHPSVLSPTSLFNELSKRSNTLNKRLDFAVPLNIENIHTLIDTSKLISYFFNNKIVFVLQLPLISPIKYVVYKIIPLPTPHDSLNPNSFALITPTKPFMALTDDRLHYTMLDNLNQCSVINNEHSICPLESIFSTISNPSCETKLLTEVTLSLPTECNSKLLYGLIDIWQKLTNNRWIFVQSKSNKLTVKCNEHVQDFPILGTGILSLSEDCIGYSKTIQLVPSSIQNVMLNNQFRIDFDITNDDCCNKETFNHTVPLLSPISLSNVDFDSLKHSYKQLDNLETIINKVQQESHFIKYSSYYSSVTIFILIAIFLYMAYKLYSYFNKKCKSNSSSCCIQIFNQCNTKRLVNTETKFHNSIELNEISEEDNVNDNTSIKSLPDNFSLYRSKRNLANN